DKPYTMLPFLTANTRSVYVVSNANIHSIDRERGGKRWEYPIPAGISAGFSVDESQIYLPTATTRVYAYGLPPGDLVEGGAAETGGGRIYTGGRTILEEEMRIRPLLHWNELTNNSLEFRAVTTPNRLFYISPNGKGVGLEKFLSAGAASVERYRITIDARIT